MASAAWKHNPSLLQIRGGTMWRCPWISNLNQNIQFQYLKDFLVSLIAKYKMIRDFSWCYIILNHLSTTLCRCSLNKAQRAVRVAFGLTSRCSTDIRTQKLSWASSSGPCADTQFVVFASILPSLFSVYTELIAKDASCNFLWEMLVRDGLNDTPRMTSRCERTKGRMKRRPRSTFPLHSSFLLLSLPPFFLHPLLLPHF